jgi:hypothetical protein
MRLNQYIEAFKEPGNLLALASFAMLSTATWDPRVLCVGAVVEALYLLVFADSKIYHKKLRDKENKLKEEVFRREFEELRQKAIGEVSKPIAERFQTLEHIRNQVEQASVDKETWYLDVVRKLDQMLMAFLNFGLKESQFRNHLHNAMRTLATQKKRNVGKVGACPDDATLEEVEQWTRDVAEHITQSYSDEIADVENKINQTQAADPNLPILQKRAELIKRRSEYAGKVGRMLVSMHHQMRLLEDTFGLISDEAQSRPPQQVLTDIEEAVFQSTLLTNAIDEFASSNEQVLTVGA